MDCRRARAVAPDECCRGNARLALHPLFAACRPADRRVAEASDRTCGEMGGTSDNGRRDCGLRAPLAVARHRRGAVDGAPKLALLAREIRAGQRHRRRGENLDRHGRHGGRLVSRRAARHGGGWPCGRPSSPPSRVESRLLLPCDIRRAWPCGELHSQGERGAQPLFPRREPDTLHRPRLPRCSRWGFSSMARQRRG